MSPFVCARGEMIDWQLLEFVLLPILWNERDQKFEAIWSCFYFFCKKKQRSYFPFCWAIFSSILPPLKPSFRAADWPQRSAQWHYCRGSSPWRWRLRTATTPRRDALTAGDWPSPPAPEHRRTCPAADQRSGASGRPSARPRRAQKGNDMSVHWGTCTADQRHPFPARRAVSWRKSAAGCASLGRSRQRHVCLQLRAHERNAQNRVPRGQ